MFPSQAVWQIREAERILKRHEPGQAIAPRVRKAGETQFILRRVAVFPTWQEAPGAGDETDMV